LSSRMPPGNSQVPLSARQIARRRSSSRTTIPATDTECKGDGRTAAALGPRKP
jgi:hypothetical protein